MRIKKIKAFLESKAELTIEDALKGILDGSIKLDINGHKIYRDYKVIIEDLLDEFYNMIERYKKNDKLSFLADRLLNDKLEIGENLNISMFNMHSIQCEKCGAYSLQLEMVSNKEIRLVSRDGDCIEDMDFIKTEINVPSGELIFTNYFRNKDIYSPGSSSISSIKGIKELADTLAVLDIGYGQMTNTSADVWKKEDGTEVLITEAYKYDEENDLDDEWDFPGYIKMGHICMDVWRWMCADKKVLEKHSEKIPEGLEKDSTMLMDHKEYTNCGVIPGKWVIEHYFTTNEDNIKDGIFSKLYKM